MFTRDDGVAPVSEHTQETEGRLQKVRLQQNGSDFSKMCRVALTSLRDNSSCSVSHTPLTDVGVVYTQTGGDVCLLTRRTLQPSNWMTTNFIQLQPVNL